MFSGPPVPSPRTKTTGGGANVTIGNISVSIVKGEIAKQKVIILNIKTHTGIYQILIKYKHIWYW